MEKIKIKLNHAQIMTVLTAFESFEWSPIMKPEQRMIRSVIADIHKKIIGKEFELRNSQKTTSISLKYYQAYALVKFSELAIGVFAPDSYERNVLIMLTNELYHEVF